MSAARRLKHRDVVISQRRRRIFRKVFRGVLVRALFGDPPRVGTIGTPPLMYRGKPIMVDL